MGGQMWVASELGRGSEFHMLVPLPPGTQPATAPPASLQGVTCLIVDDNLTNRKILHAITTQWSMKSDAVESAVLALSALEAAASGNNAYKLVLIDGHMPHMDGFQLAERIRQNPKLTRRDRADADLGRAARRHRSLPRTRHLRLPHQTHSPF